MSTASTPDPDPFASWCRRLAASDERAFEELFRATHGPLVRYATTFTHDRTVAGDLVQDVYVRVWERRTTLDPNRSLKALLYRMTRNLALNRMRDRQNRRDLLMDYAPALYADPDPDVQVEGHEFGLRLEAWIAALPERQREALRLSRFEGMSHEQIADVMDISPRTVNNHLVKALKHLRDRTIAYEPSLIR
ncbi:MAG: RNA polymerase sigma-70 factor [Bacteroidota bacterium]